MKTAHHSAQHVDETAATPTGGESQPADNGNGSGVPADTISTNRALPVVAASAIPAPAEGFRATDADTRARVLRKVNGQNIAEGKQSLDQIIARGPLMASDFGKNAPKTAYVASLRERIRDIEASLVRAHSLTNSLEEQYEISLSDMSTVSSTVADLYNANITADPTIQEHYTEVVKFVALHGASISQGIARKKETQAQIDAAAKAQAPGTGK